MAVNSVYDFTMDSLEGKGAPLSIFRGKVLLIVNVATFWGSTIEEVTVTKDLIFFNPFQQTILFNVELKPFKFYFVKYTCIIKSMSDM